MDKIIIDIDITEKIKKISYCDLIKIKILNTFKEWKILQKKM